MLQETFVAEGDVSTIADHELVEKADVEQLPLPEPRRDGGVLCGALSRRAANN